MSRNVNVNAARIFAVTATATAKRYARRTERQTLNRATRLAMLDAMANADARKHDALRAQAEIAGFTFAALPDTTLDVSTENDLGLRVVRDTQITVVRNGQTHTQNIRRDAFIAWTFCAFK
jgi:type II secretory pathway pseudopilin PulG